VTAAAVLAAPASAGRPLFTFALGLSCFDRRALTDIEVDTLRELGPAGLRRSRAHGGATRAPLWAELGRLAEPLDEARALLQHPQQARYRRASAQAAGLVLQHCADTGRVYWTWTREEWARLFRPSAESFLAAQVTPTDTTVRPFLVALGYLLGGFDDFHLLGRFNRLHLAQLVFGATVVETSLRTATQTLDGWGYRGALNHQHRLRGGVSQALLINRSPLLEDLDTAAFARLRALPATNEHHGELLFALQRAVAGLGHCDPPVRSGRMHMPVIEGASPEWAGWVERWHATSTLTPRARGIVRTIVAKAGRWLAAEHPEITEPSQWTRQTCAAWVAAIDRMRVGDYVQRTDSLGGRAGTLIAPRTKAHMLMASRMFFRDCQEWEWIPRRSDPARALALPRSVAALIGTNPRVIADEVWAKLLWAGLNPEPTDLPGNSADTYYPMSLIRAVTLTWLFGGLRSDELSRLRVGCVRWQHDGAAITADDRHVLATDAVCLLDIPVHKTGVAFTKPVDPLIGQAIEAWHAARPAQPTAIDRKTGERADMLFAVRGQPIARTYINQSIIPALCGKAGVPAADVRGKITSHRARSTIASQLYNAKDPMTLFELQAWLGHSNPNTTQHYAKIAPNTLAKAYQDAGYFARNLRTIEVLLDRDAITSGAAATGQPWQHYDLGHGWCSYSFFEQCQHRMACARCDFYTPKGSAQAQLLEANDSLQRMLAEIPLTDDEQAAVNDDRQALTRLLDRLTDTPTPSGPTPRQIGVPPTATVLPIISVRHS
jgi:integrase